MISCTRKARYLILCSHLALFAADHASAEGASLGGLTLGTWDGSAGATFSYSHDKTQTDGSTSTTFDDRFAMFDLDIRNNGWYVFSPALVTGSLGIDLGLDKNTATSQGITSSSEAKLLGYSFDAEFFNEFPYGGMLFASKHRSTTIQPFGHQENTSSSRGASLRLSEGSPLKDMGLPYLRANLRVEHSDLDELNTSSIGQTFQYREQRDTFIHDGHKGSETSDLDWRIEIDDLKQPLTTNGNYRSNNASLNYNTDFGPTLNRHWLSRMNWMDRAGTTSLSTFTMDEQLHVDHWSNLSTDYGYQQSRVDSQNQPPNVYQTGSFAISYKPYQNLSSRGFLQRQFLPTGRIDQSGGTLGYAYQHSLAGSGKLQLSAIGGYQVTNIISTLTIGHIVEEAHAMPDLTGPNPEIVLAQVFVVQSSIPVLGFKSGVSQAVLIACPGTNFPAPPPSAQTCDYIVDPPLGNLTKIRLNPYLIQHLNIPIDALSVSYDFEVPPSLRYATTSNALSAVVNYRWIIFTLAHDESDVKLISGGDDRFLPKSRHNREQIDLTGTWRSLQVAAGVAYLQTRETELIYHQRHFYQTASYPYSYNLAFSFNADQNLTDYELPQRHSDSRSANLSADWHPGYNLWVNAMIGQRSTKDSLTQAETVKEAKLKAQWKYGKMRVISSLTANQRVRGGSELSNWLADLTVRREF